MTPSQQVLTEHVLVAAMPRPEDYHQEILANAINPAPYFEHKLGKARGVSYSAATLSKS